MSVGAVWNSCVGRMGFHGAPPAAPIISPGIWGICVVSLMGITPVEYRRYMIVCGYIRPREGEMRRAAKWRIYGISEENRYNRIAVNCAAGWRSAHQDGHVGYGCWDLGCSYDHRVRALIQVNNNGG